jgi:hypothetical protein
LDPLQGKKTLASVDWLSDEFIGRYATQDFLLRVPGSEEPG